jgi:hypothetical protein
LVDVVRDAREALGSVGHRQQVVEKAAVVAGPGQMLGKELRCVAIDEYSQTFEMIRVQRTVCTNRQTYTV